MGRLNVGGEATNTLLLLRIAAMWQYLPHLKLSEILQRLTNINQRIMLHRNNYRNIRRKQAKLVRTSAVRQVVG
jgi:hypothetical protein